MSPQPARTSLLADHDALLLDLDGVVWTGAEAVTGAVAAIAAARQAGAQIAFVTNNASRTPGEVAERLRRVGVPATPQQVHTSSEAAARLVALRCGHAATVLAVGGPGVGAALRAEGLDVVLPGPHPAATAGRVDAVVQGFGPQVCWHDLAAAGHAVRAGALWVATNTDPTLPTEDGPAPGNGSLVAAVRAAAGVDPVVAGKPEAPLLCLAAERAGAREPLVVGDRLDTDVAGARAAGLRAALVLTGVSGPGDVLAAPAGQRPDLLLADLGGLHRPASLPAVDAAGWRCGAAVARLDGGRLRLDDGGDGGPDGLDRLRAAAAAVWRAADDGEPVDLPAALALLEGRVGAGR